MTLQTVTVDQPIAASADRVWDRISTPEGIAKWWRPGDIAPVVGHEFKMQMGKWGDVPCRVIEVDAPTKLAFTFADFELHWTILPTAKGCILRLEHRGFDLNNPEHQFTHQNMGPGWRDIILPELAKGLSEAA